jgi:hypothetical protein
MVSHRFVGITLAVVLAGIGSAALSAPSEPTLESFLVDVTLRDGDDDVVQSDSPTYAGNEVNAWIINRFGDADDAFPPGDFFRFHPTSKRTLHLSHPAIEGSPVACVSGTWGPTGVDFRSHSTSQWFEVMQADGSALGTARVVCQLDKKGQNILVVRYPGTADDGGEGECVQATLTSTEPLTIRFSAEPYVPGSPGDPGFPPLVPPTEPTPASGCPATIVQFAKDQPSEPFTETELASETSAPFEITAVEKPGKGSPKKS